MQKQLHTIETLEELEALDVYLNEYDADVMAVDTETTGLDFFCKDIGISISVEPNEGFYIITREYDALTRTVKDLPIRKVVKSYLQKWLTKKKRYLVFHNAIFDLRVIQNNYGITLVDQVLADTRILFKMCVSEDDPANLKDLGVRFLTQDAKEEQADLKRSVESNGGKWNKTFKEIYKGDKYIIAKYGAQDTCLTLGLYNTFLPILEADKQLKELWEVETLPLLEVIFRMNTTPFLVDLDHFNKIKGDMQGDIARLQDEIINEIRPLILDYEEELIIRDTKYARNDFAKQYCKDLGWDIKTLPLQQVKDVKIAVYKRYYGGKSPFKLTSTKDLTWLIYTKLGEPVSKKTETGNPSVDGDVILALSHKYGWAKKLLEKKSLEKLLSTYVEGVLRDHINGTVYFDFDQCGTISGRFSTKSGVPIMTLPKGDKRIKKGFVAPKGYKLVAMDYSSLEPHLAAYNSQDPKLIDSFISGKDFYSVIGIEQFKKYDATPYKDGTPNSFPVKYEKFRDLVKEYSLASLYGAEDHRISEVLHPESCDWQTRNIYRKEAHDLLEGYFTAFPGIRRLINESHMEAHLTGQIRTKFGRIRHMPLVKEVYAKHGLKLKDGKYAKQLGLSQLRREYKNFLNNSVNFKIQGLAAHACNRAMIMINAELKRQGLNAWIAVQVHDEIICIALEEQAQEVYNIMKDCMSKSVDISPIVLKTEGKIGNNLAECK